MQEFETAVGHSRMHAAGAHARPKQTSAAGGMLGTGVDLERNPHSSNPEGEAMGAHDNSHMEAYGAAKKWMDAIAGGLGEGEPARTANELSPAAGPEAMDAHCKSPTQASSDTKH